MPDPTPTERLEAMESALMKCLGAMNQAQRDGVLDHLDACDDGGQFWHEAKEAAEEALAS